MAVSVASMSVGVTPASRTMQCGGRHNNKYIQNAVPSSAPLRDAPIVGECSKEDLVAYYKEGFELNKLLFSGIRDQAAMYENPDPLRRPLVFYMGHTDAFTMVKLEMAGLCSGINPHLEGLFERGVWELASCDTKQSDKFTWPALEAVNEYKNAADQRVLEVLSRLSDNDLGRRGDEARRSGMWAVHMVMEHERIHFETSSMLIRQLSASKCRRPRTWSYCPSRAQTRDACPANKMLTIPGGSVVMGRPVDSNGVFGWCNEYGTKTEKVPTFKVSAFVVSNAEFYSFVSENGYSKKQYWSDEGSEWVGKTGACHPLFWVPETTTCDVNDLGSQALVSVPAPNHRYKYRAMFDIVDMPWDWPAEVNAHEAEAFLAWKSERDGTTYMLPSEAEFHRYTHGGEKCEEVVTVAAGGSANNATNIAMRWGSPSPVHHHDVTTTGNVWQMTRSDFLAFPGHRAHPLYDDFSEPHFGAVNRVALGGSWASCGNQATKTYRVWWNRHFYQHMSFRYVQAV